MCKDKDVYTHLRYEITKKYEMKKIALQIIDNKQLLEITRFTLGYSLMKKINLFIKTAGQSRAAAKLIFQTNVYFLKVEFAAERTFLYIMYQILEVHLL